MKGLENGAVVEASKVGTKVGSTEGIKDEGEVGADVERSAVGLKVADSEVGMSVLGTDVSTDEDGAIVLGALVGIELLG